MADFTDSDDERAVEEVLSKAMDHSVLEQVAAINCSSFASDSDLPPDLNTRFQKLKSFPITNNKNSTVSVSTSNKTLFSPTRSKSLHDNVFNSPSNKKKESEADFRFSPSDLSTETPTKLKYRIGKVGSPSGGSWSSSSSTESFSPPRRSACFWFSQKKKVSQKKCKENRIEIDWDKDDDGILSKFSTKEKQKILKKAMKEEEKINREAEKIVKWAKQASARMMDVSAASGVDELEDDEISE